MSALGIAILLASWGCASADVSRLAEEEEVVEGGFVDLHADTPLWNIDLDDNTHVGWSMRMWFATVRALGHVFPTLQNFSRHVTTRTLERRGSGLQIFSTVTQGLPPFFDASFALYTTAAAWVDEGNASTFNAFMHQVAWVYRQVEGNSKLVFASPSEDVQSVVRHGKIAVQIAMEGAFPLEVNQRDWPAFQSLVNRRPRFFPRSMPLPGEQDLKTTSARVAFLQKAYGLSYVSLNHLQSSSFAGSDLIGSRNRHSGVTPSGIALVQALDKYGVLLDAAHASQQAQRDLVDLVERGMYSLPLLVSHGVVAKPGALPDWRETLPELLDVIRASGGVFGIMFARVFLPHRSAEDVVDQMDWVRERVGMDVIALGSDADGMVGLVEKDLPSSVDAVVEAMKRRGYNAEEIAKACRGNVLRMLATRDRILAARKPQDEELAPTQAASKPK